LNLSLNYDIIKAHRGVPIAIAIAIGIKIETMEGEGVEFMIELPIKIKKLSAKC
jgi:hypothetical protein